MIDAIKPAESKPANAVPANDPVVAPGQVLAQQTAEHSPTWSESPGFSEPALTSQPKPPQPYSPQPSNSYHQAQTNELTQQPPLNTYGSNRQQPAQDQWQTDQWGSAGEWPMMVSAEPKKSSRKTLLLLLVLLLVAGGGAAAYLKRNAIKNMLGMGQAKNPEPSKGQDPVRATSGGGNQSGTSSAVSQMSSNVRTTANSNGSQIQVAPTQAASGPSQGTPGASTQTPANSNASTPVQSTAPPLPGQKLYALQAASFPNDGGAKQYSERLVRAGVPAYVVSADIPHRGRWYRVRAGRFATADEARKYAADWQQRARAAGINIQLVTCDYTQP
ncbi:MAG TPA: SPOR domain-containing protein [Blastocatellia bacterium]|nr:SPOR domain-containing protein [Blastocatellia bacterium]